MIEQFFGQRSLMIPFDCNILIEAETKQSKGEIYAKYAVLGRLL